MLLLIVDQLCRIGERNRDDGNAASLKLTLSSLHLAEVGLAWESSQMPQKDQQNALVKICEQIDSATLQIEQRQMG